MIQFRVTYPLGDVKVIPLDKTVITIGRHPSNDLVLDDELVSRFHAEIEVDDQRILLLDLGSRNGLHVNEEKMLEATLKDGDVIRIGKILLELRRADRSKSDTNKVVAVPGRVEDTDPGRLREKKLEVRTRYSSGIEWVRMSPEEIYQWRNYIQFQMHLSDALLQALDLESFMHKVMTFLQSIVPYARAAYLSWNDDRKHLEPRYVHSSAAIAPGTKVNQIFPVSFTITEESLREEKIITCSNAMADARYSHADSVTLLELRSVLCIPLVGREGPLGVIHMDSDRGELAQTEEDINFLNLISHFIAMGVENFQLREERSDREKSTAIARTLSILSENLKTRLMILKGKFSLLESRMQSLADDNQGRLFKDVKTDFDQLTHVLDGMINYTHGRQITYHEINPNELLIDFARRLNPELNERGIKINLGLEKAVTECWIDFEGVDQCLDYLVRNAIEAVEGREGAEIGLLSEIDDNHVSIIVQDNGPGMSHTTLGRVQQPFYSTKGREHVGLGLTFARKLAEDMGGRLDVQSEVDYGTTFSLVLPRKLPVEQE